ncbi:MAG: DUF11 domain-containing protein, partial [bacterium]|nr:DUF11 domain-containing protein [bacterium]
LTFVSATDGGSYDGPSRTITWNVGDLPSGSGTSTVTFTVTVDNPYPPTADIPLPNTAEINSDQTGPDTADASLYVNSPRPDLTIEKDGSLTQVTPAVSPGGNVTFTITYANVGNADAYNVVITDPVPAGWSFVSASPPGVFAAGTVSWALGTVTAGTTATVTTVLNADPGPPANPTTNTAYIDGTIDVPGLIPLAQRSDDFDVGITQTACATPTTFYFHDATIDPGTGTLERTATTTAGVDPGTFVSSPVTQVQVDFLYFYEDPVSTLGSLSSTTTTVTYWAQKTQGNPTVHLTLYDYDPATDTRVQLGAGTGSAGGTVKQYTITWTAAWSATVPAGHRLEWVFGVSGTNSSQIDVHFDGVTDSDSRSDVCRTPLSAVVDKQTSSLAVTPGSPPLTLT